MQKSKIFSNILDKRLLFFLVLALALRVWGVDFGLPYLYHQDEPRIVDHGLTALVNHLNPDYFVVPGFTMYITAFSAGIVYFLGLLSGIFSSSDDFLTYFLSDPSLIYLLSRGLVGILPSTVCVATVYLAGRRLFDQVTASKAALIAACVPILVQHAHYIYTESLLSLGIFVLTTLLIAANRNTPLSRFVWIGVALGWSTSVKYTALYFAPVMLFRYFQIYGRTSFQMDPIKKIITATFVSLVTYFIFSPYSFLAWSDFRNAIQTQSEAENPVGFLHHFVYSLGYGVGPIILILASVGLVIWFRKDRSQGIFIMIWSVFYYLINTHFSQYFARYVIPLVPIICLLAGIGWGILRNALSRHKILLGVLNILVLTSILLPTIQSNLLFRSEDTRTTAKKWVEANLQPKTGIAISSRAFSPRLRQSDDQIYQKLQGEDLNHPTARVKRQLKLIEARKSEIPYHTFAIEWEKGWEALPYFSIHPLVSSDLELMTQNGIEYILIDTQEFRAKSSHFLEINQKRLERVMAFSPYKNKKQISEDPHDSPALPHSWPELLSRKSSGPYIELYRIVKDAL